MNRYLIKLIYLIFLLLLFLSCKKEIKNDVITISFWTNKKDTAAEIEYLEDLIGDFTKMNRSIEIDLLHKDSISLKSDLETIAMAGSAPDLILSNLEHGIFCKNSGILQKVDRFIKPSLYVLPEKMQNDLYFIPFSTGGHTLLFINSRIVKSIPTNTDDLIAVAKKHNKNGKYGLLFNPFDSNQLLMWFNGYNGSLFKLHESLPELNNPALINALLLTLNLYNISMKNNTDFREAEDFFKEGKAAMILNGDWAITQYKKALGEDLAIIRIPKISSTGIYPSSLYSGNYLMISSHLERNKKRALKSFIAHLTSEESQRKLMQDLYLLPGLNSVLKESLSSENLLIQSSLKQIQNSQNMPMRLEYLYILEAIDSQLPLFINKKISPEQAVKEMQNVLVEKLELNDTN